MNDNAELIRLEIQETKNNLDLDLIELENRLKGRVQGAKQMVEQKIDEVKSEAKKLTPSYQVQERPLLMVSGAIATGVLLGSMLGGKGARSSVQGSASPLKEAAPVQPGDSSFGRPKAPQTESVLHHLVPEMKTLRNMAIQAAVVFMGKKAKEALPKYNDDIELITNGVIRKIPSL